MLKIVTVVAFAFVCCAANAVAADIQVVKDADLQDLTRLSPLSPSVKAILAYEAMLASTGCPRFRAPDNHVADDGKLHCALTDALGLGYQCSPAHTEIVTHWFGRNLKKLLGRGVDAEFVLKQQDWSYFCQTAADEASAQSTWVSLHLRIFADRVIIDGEISSRNRDSKRGIYAYAHKIHDVFRVHDDWVEIVSRTS